VLADQIGDDPPVFYNAELLDGNRRNLGAPKPTADQDSQDGAVPFSPNGVRIWNAKKLPGACRVQPLPDTDTVQANAVDLRDCGCDACIEETVIARFLGQAPHGRQPLIDRRRGHFLFDEHCLVSVD
jgi:hypothetical protein